MHDPRQQIAAAECGQAGRCQPLEPLIDLHPAVGQEPERGIMPDEPLFVPQESTGKSEELDQHDGHGEMGLVGMLGGSRDQPGGGTDQSDVRRDGTRPQ